MRRILVESARRQRRLKHGGDLQRLDLDHLDVAIASDDDQLLAVSEVLDKLADRDAKVSADLIKLRFSPVCRTWKPPVCWGIPERSAKRAWAYAARLALRRS